MSGTRGRITRGLSSEGTMGLRGMGIGKAMMTGRMIDFTIGWVSMCCCTYRSGGSSSEFSEYPFSHYLSSYFLSSHHPLSDP